MGASFHRWLYISFINLLIVAFIGVILRYKIAFSLPFIDQKHLLDGHSHFAFSGWITQALMVLLVQYLCKSAGIDYFKKYRFFLFCNCLSAYGMLFFFSWQGYQSWSIGFSVISIINAYLFSFCYWKDLDSLTTNSQSHRWFKAAILFNVISSFGFFALAYMMSNKIIHQSWYLAAIYYFLHFQYNGWFFFAAMGLLISRIEKMVIAPSLFNMIFLLFSLSCAPAYFLSALWMKLPLIIYGLVITSAVAQFAGWVIFIKVILRNKTIIKQGLTKQSRQLLLLSAVALTIKLLLQLGSTHPVVSQLAFGFRPIVIGYLHLVLLGIFTIFILGYTVSMDLLNIGNYFMRGVWIFIAGIIVNEILLMCQGVTGFNYISIPFIHELLLGAATIMFSGILIFIINLRNHKQLDNEKE